MGKYEDFDWVDLPKHAQEAAKVLGYDQAKWDGDIFTAASNKSFDELNAKEKEAVKALGYDQTTWDDDSDSSSSSSSEEE
eukprot:CAMPEP_0172424820 /NCGR_PEP_ID=MMETSP1064-20121228/28440_1 /TAXON_ID=202472 /ORGANISM="Aulacoseira subarctica , Strain CCAP 1002/5" /LENGTH=79 /DNA_ID=CAMNT_0013167223 /DNA_START=134 /DNA_END=373 /DNA_ORIENTATION=-